ncbi:putative ribonuclease H-like domain-containing protein, partial [Tanacetum coccineum]
TSCASTSSVSTSESEAEIESNVGTPIQEPIIVQDLPSFSCNSSDKNENTSRTSCNKNGYFNKKAGHFRKNASSVSKLCFVCGSSTHLIKDCDFYEKQMANKTVGNGVGPVHSRNNVNHQNQFVPQAVLLRTGKVNIPPARPQPVPTGKPKVPAPVTTGRQNRPFPVPTDRGYSPSVTSDVEDKGIFDSGCSRNTDCLVLSKDFMLPDESMVVLRVPRKHNLYTINLNNLSPRGNLACLVAKASVNESVKWHRRMGHVNYKNMNRLVKGKQHKASYKAITAVSSISKPLQLLHMDLFSPTSFRSIDHKYYCLVITDDYSRKPVEQKGIKRDYSNARTPQQNGVAERKNRTLIEAARTMLADSKLPTMFWTEAVRTACYVLNRVLVTSPHNKTPYALLTGNIPSVSHFKPFGCHVSILNTSYHLGKFDGKADEGYIVGYSASNRAYRVYNVPNKRVEETMNLRYLEEKPNEHKKLQLTLQAEPQDTSGDEVDNSPLDSAEEIFQQELARLKGQEQRATSDAKDVEELQKRASPKTVPIGSIPVPSGDTTISPSDVSVPTGGVLVPTGSPTDLFFDDEPTTRFPSPLDLGNNEPTPGIFSSSSYDDEFGADLNNLASTVEFSPMATKRINTIHPQSLIIEDYTSAVLLSVIFMTSRETIIQTFNIDEMQQFKFQNVWVLVDLPEGKYAIGTKCVGSRNTSLHRINHEIGLEMRKRDELFRERKKREREMREFWKKEKI